MWRRLHGQCAKEEVSSSLLGHFYVANIFLVYAIMESSCMYTHRINQACDLYLLIIATCRAAEEKDGVLHYF